MSRRDTLIVFLGCMVCASNAMAYLDPNSGGLIFQLLAPMVVAFVGWSALIKRKMRSGLLRLLSIFHRKVPAPAEKPPSAN